MVKNRTGFMNDAGFGVTPFGALCPNPQGARGKKNIVIAGWKC